MGVTRLAGREEGRAVGISLWLLPDKATHERLSARIRTLAAPRASAVFDPHVTVVGGLRGGRTALLDRARRLAASTPPVPIRLVRAVVRDEYFRRLVLEAEPTAGLLRLREQSLRAFGAPEPGFEPHLSLLYGHADVSVAEAGVELPLDLTCPELAVWRTEGPVERWRLLLRVPLGSGSAP